MSDPTSVIDRYAEGGPLLKYATAGLPSEKEATRVEPGLWSLSELVAHLLDADLVLADRMKRVIAEQDPVLLAFDENAWIDRLDSRSMPVEEAVALFTANRRWMTRILHNCSEADFARSGQHTEVGRLTLAELVAKTISHLDHHLVFLYAKRAALGTAVPPRYTAR
ncbi:DinB superfamily protein [Singulisphaera sp. GP187]|uniref:DinB family protein n=1 Tax=Singulisphaera sp. GP187 TaxID=1882752 RepID=UPI0009287D63|nr:DinB family protein [Singulisphaera sp. GP187]SIN76949.1 DinB superfamily protein [Singulisphaera sp. GP187]